LCCEYGVEFCCILCSGEGRIYWTDKVRGVKNEKLPDGVYGPFEKKDGKWHYDPE